MTNPSVLRHVKGIVIDMDGVLWVGDRPLPGLRELFGFLAAEGIGHVLVTNNASRTPEHYAAKLARFGVVVPPRQVLTSALATAAWLRQRLPPGSRVHVVGQEGLRRALGEAGFVVVRDARGTLDDGGPADDSPRAAGAADGGGPADAPRPAGPADGGGPADAPRPAGPIVPVAAVVAGIDFALSYAALRDAVLLVRRGAMFVGTNPDLTYPTEDGLAPGAGAILAAIRAATDVEPTIIGKPEPHLFAAALTLLGTPPDSTAVLGDRLSTDLLGARRAGLIALLVRTGVDADGPPTATVTPDAEFRDLPALVTAWRSERASS